MVFLPHTFFDPDTYDPDLDFDDGITFEAKFDKSGGLGELNKEEIDSKTEAEKMDPDSYQAKHNTGTFPIKIDKRPIEKKIVIGGVPPIEDVDKTYHFLIRAVDNDMSASPW
jgi:hypothetical protein